MEKDGKLELLRQSAERIIFDGKNSIGDVDGREVKRIFHELQLHQLELEMQNDELQRTAAQLEQQKTILSNLFELAPIGYFVTDKTGLVQNVNEAGCKLLGVNKYRLVNRPFLLCVHKDDYDTFYVYLRKLIKTSGSISTPLKLTGSNHEIFHVQVEGIALNPNSENTICYLTITDFTERIQAAQKANEASQTLEMALDATLTGIWEYDILSGQVYLDNFCCSLYGFVPDYFDRQYETLLNRIHPADRKGFDENMKVTLSGEKALNLKFRVILPDKNSTYIQARARLIQDQDERKRFIGMFTDITEKTLTEQEAVRAREEQQQMILAAGLQAEENEKKRISEVLHDGIAQMLYAMKLNIDQLKKTEEKPSFEYLTNLLHQSIRDIRNVSFELAPSILNDFGLEATLEDMATRLISNTLKVDTKISPTCKSLPFQTQLNIFRIIQELVNNSIKHAQASNISIEVTRKAKNTFIIVTDNGIGFKTNNPTEAPKGIGLSSIKNRLRLYKGVLKIESEPETGTTVHISLNTN